MRFLILFLFSLPAFATDKPEPPRPTPQHQSQVQESENWQRQAQNQQTNTNANAQGGNIGDISADTTFLSLWGNITQVQVSDCMAPARGKGRSQSWFWGVFSISGYSEVDEACVSAKIQILQAQAQVLEAQNEAERLRQENERLRSEVSECRRTDVCQQK